VFLPLVLLIVALAAPAVTANGLKCGHHHHHAPPPVPAGPSSTATPASDGMSPVPMQPSGAEAPAPSPVAAGPEHSNGAAIMPLPLAWQTVVLGAVGVAATMIHPKDRSGCNMIPQAENTFY
jgi:hypothetical protein